ncbi:hypothetical protein GMI70_09480 [Eggerthellaceae bacterium zg-893]|nr:hypothetical protein [Eggerthellaceae bacterium zg-893]
MNGKKITVGESFTGRPIVNNGELTVDGNGTIDASASSTNGYGAIRNDGTLTIMNGTFIGGKHAGGASLRNGNDSTLTVYDGRVEGCGAICNDGGHVTLYKGKYVSLSCSDCFGKAWSYALNNLGGTMEILPEKDEDISVHGTQGALGVAHSSSVHVKGGTFYTEPCDQGHADKTFYPVYVSAADGRQATCVIDGGKFSTSGSNSCIYVGNDDESDNGGTPSQGILRINGGSFNKGTGGAVLIRYSPNNGNILAISGGTFSDDVREYPIDPDLGGGTQSFLTDNVECYHGGNGTWTAAVDHTPRTSGAVAATCTSAGSTGTTVCSACGDLISAASVLPATGHSFGAWETDVEPTCTEDGSQTRACSRCGEAQTEAVPALGHAWEDGPTVDVPPTCTDDGSESVHCARCGETKDAAALPALGHDFGEGIVTVEPTATQDGVLTFTCSRCSATKTEPIPATGPAPHEHDFADAPWERDAHVHWRTCTVEGCGAASAKEPHAFGGWTVTKDPTTTEAGAQARACGACGLTQTETLPVLEPDANGWVEADDGTWQLVGEGGRPVEEGWQEVGGEWYYFSESAMQTGWEQVGDTWYYLEDSGAMATGWQEVDGKWYYLNGAGEGVEGSMATGWKEVEGDWYYLEKSGAMATGWQQVGGTWYYLAEKGKGTEGSMATGWKLVDGSWFRFEGSGAMLSGWQKVGGVWYLLNAAHDGTFGRMLEGWQQVNGSTGKPTSANSWYYLNPGSGAMAASTRVGGYYVDASGRWRPGR